MRQLAMTTAGVFLFACSAAQSGNFEQEGPAGAKPHIDAPAPNENLSALEYEAVDLEPPLHAYTIDLEPGHSVSYWVYADGATITGERGVQGVHDVMGKTPIGTMSPVEVFQKAKPGVPVPQELLDIEAALAGAREFEDSDAPIHDEFTSVGSGSASERPEPLGLLPKETTSNPTSFLSIFGCFFGQDDVFDACHTNFPGNAFAAARSRWAIYKMGPYLGSVRFLTSVNGSPRVSLTIGQGGFWVTTASGRIRDQDRCGRRYPDIADHRLDIFSTGEHHFSGRFHNYRTESWRCAEVASSDSGVFPPCGGAIGCRSHYD